MPKGSTTQRIIGETQNASFEDRGTALREQRSTNNPLATSESWDVSLLLLKRLLRPTVCLSLSSFLLLSPVLSWVRPSWKPWSRTHSAWSRLVSSRCLWSKPQRWSVEDQSETPHMLVHTDRRTHDLFLLFIKLLLLHHHLSIFPQFLTLVGEGPSSSRKSDSVSLSLFSISIFISP